MKDRGVLILICIILLLSGGFFCSTPQQDNYKSETERHIRFLSSDKMKGRKTGTPEIDSAASYIASFLKEFDIQPITGSSNFFQTVRLKTTHQPDSIELRIGDDNLSGSRQITLIQGNECMKKGEILYVDEGLEENMEDLDVRDKIVISKFGYPNESLFDYLVKIDQKVDRIQMMGASALIEVVEDKPNAWAMVRRLFNGSRFDLDLRDSYGDFHHLWVFDSAGILNSLEKEQITAEIKVSGYQPEYTISNNILGVLPGRSKANEYVMLTAHYDHVGVGKAKVLPDGTRDSIFNGARDNAVGAVALMMAAKSLAADSPDRSVIFLATTAEEEGILGSRWYVRNSPIPLIQTVFNVNIDGAGYNDTSIATLAGVDKTNVRDVIRTSCLKAGLEIYSDPEIDKQFYFRSDNAHFAIKGIPSITYSLGFKTFDEQLSKYYHKVIDEADDLDYRYLDTWIKGYVHTIRDLGNISERPFWKEGDPFYEIGEALYGGD